MTKQVLIAGYGRAGKRHAKLAENFGLGIAVLDPYITECPYKYYKRLDEVSSENYDYIVIATPPADHLGLIQYFAGQPILCEKPLCGFDEIADAEWLGDLDNVLVAYNYRWHDGLLTAKKRKYQSPLGWGIASENYRPGGIPAWGLLLDHVSHAVDTMRFMSDAEHIALKDCWHLDGELFEEYQLWGVTDRGDFSISEKLWKEPHDRLARINCCYGCIDIDPDEKMFVDMWKSFLSGKYYPDIKDALKTQRILQQAHEMSYKEDL